MSELKVADLFHVLIQLRVSLSVCWCWSGCVCGSLAGRNCVCGTKTSSCSLTDRTTATLVRRNKRKPNYVYLRHYSLHMQLINVVFVFLHFAGIIALIELPKNCIAAAMDKEIGKRKILIISFWQECSCCAQMEENVMTLYFFLLSVIYRVTVSTDSSVSVAEIRCLSDHQDQIRALINVNGQSLQGSWEIFVTIKVSAFEFWHRIDCCLLYMNQVLVVDLSSSDGLFASGSHAGELILWDSVDWNILAYEHILWEESQSPTQSEIRLGAPKTSEMSIQHLSTNGKVRMTGWLNLLLCIIKHCVHMFC